MELKEKEGKPFSYTDMTAEMWSHSVGILLVAEKGGLVKGCLQVLTSAFVLAHNKSFPVA